MKCLMELEGMPFSWQEKLAWLTWRFLDLEQKETPVTHIFKDGLYIREMLIPAQTLFIGRPHRYGHRCQLLEGKILLILENAKRHVEAPMDIKTDPNFQMVLYAKTDVLGRTYHQDTGERDIEVLEREIFEPIESMIALGKDVNQRMKPYEVRMDERSLVA